MASKSFINSSQSFQNIKRLILIQFQQKRERRGMERMGRKKEQRIQDVVQVVVSNTFP
jgi:hypothetical protein